MLPSTTTEYSIEFAILPGDITAFEADVIALKHAQGFFGADEAVADALARVDVPKDELRAPPDNYRYVETRSGVRAKHALFVGVVPLPEFDYPQIREFATRVLYTLTAEAPETRHLAMTIHGPGFWRDEAEALLAEFAGCLEALENDTIPYALERISLVDRNAERVQRLRNTLEKYLAEANYATRIPGRWAYRLSVKRPKRMGHAGAIIAPPERIQLPDAGRAVKQHAFVAMPFKKEMEDVFYFGIQVPVRAAGLLCELVNQEAFTGDILARVRERIETASLVVAELTGANPNVYLEIGYAWGRQRPTVLLIKKGEEPRFDLRGQRCLIYESIKDLEEALTKELNGLKSQGII